MRKLVACLALLLALLVPSALAEGNRLLTLEGEEYLQALVSCGDTLYILGEDRLYSWREGDEYPAAWEVDIPLPAGEDGVSETLGAYALCLFADGDQLRGACMLWGSEGEPEALGLFDVVLDGGAVRAENPKRVALPDDIRDQEYWSLSAACACGGALVVLGEGQDGPSIAIIDPSGDRKSRYAALSDWSNYSLGVMGGSPVLVQNSFEDGEEVLRLSRVLPDAGLETLCELPEGTWGVACGDGGVCAMADGRVRPIDPATGEAGEPFASLPMDPSCAALLDGGRFYAAAMGNRVAVLDTSGRLEEDRLLTISCTVSDEWLTNAVRGCCVERPEICPVSGQEYRTEDQVLGDMLSQTREPDIYILNCQDAAYRAMLERGFMLPLEGSGPLEALAGRVYPGVREALGGDGGLMALPVSADSFGMGVSPTALEALGLSIDQVPGDWEGFLDFLEQKVAPALGALGENQCFTYDDMSAQGFREVMFINILNSFIASSQVAGVMPDYEDPALVAALERLDRMDLAAFGLPEAEDEDGIFYGWTSGVDYLLQLDLSYGFGDTETRATPVLLGFGDSLPGVLPLNVQAAFVNPYSAHADEAVAFLEALSDRLPTETMYLLCPDLNEPVRRPEADGEIAEYEKRIADLQARLESAEPIDRQVLEQELAWNQASLEEYRERGSWLIPEGKLAWYRANGDRVTVSVPSWFDKDNTGEAGDLVRRYEAGELSVADFLHAVNQKARMLALEG